MTRMCRHKIAGGAESLRGSTGTLERLALLCRASLVLICATSATSKVKRLLLQDMCLPQVSWKHCGQSSQNPSMKECTGSQIVLCFRFTVHLFSDGRCACSTRHSGKQRCLGELVSPEMVLPHLGDAREAAEANQLLL